MYQVKFESMTEIRMMSSYKGGKVQLIGGYFPSDWFTHQTFQDRFSCSQDGRLCLLVIWDFIFNEPGFRIVRVSDHNRQVELSQRVEGFCLALKMNSDLSALVTVESRSGTKDVRVTDFEVASQTKIDQKHAEDILARDQSFSSRETLSEILALLMKLEKSKALRQIEGKHSLAELLNSIHALDFVYLIVETVPGKNCYELTYNSDDKEGKFKKLVKLLK